MQPPLPAPTAQGVFAKTPFPHLLVYAMERGLTGTFELTVGGESAATLLVMQGFPAKVRTTEGVHFLGDVMVELGLITAEQLKASHERMQESPRLQGQILVELGAIDEAQLDVGLQAQLERKLEHLFVLPPDTTYAYFDGLDALQRFGGPPTAVDPLPVLWRGVRQTPSWEHVDATLRRVGACAVRLKPTSQVERFGFARTEVGAIEMMRQRPVRVVDLTNAKVIGPSAAQLLVYCLVITKQVDLVETPSMRPPGGAVRPPPAPAPTMPGAPPAAPSGPPSAGAPSQAFARVQLQARQVQRAPLVVEEMPVEHRPGDGRIASPIPQAIPLPMNAPGMPGSIPTPGAMPALGSVPAPAITEAPVAPVVNVEGPMDIAAMITTTIQSSLPPPMAAALSEPPPASAPPPPPSSQHGVVPAPPSSGSIPAAPGSSPGGPLTAEQNALKMKILERAEQISSQNYFQMLGLEQDATPEAVQKAFFALAKVWHPDRLPGALFDVKDACSKVFTHLTEAHATLTDATKRGEYMTLLKDGGATPDDQRKIQAVLEAATEFQKAEIVFKRNDLAQAYELARRAYELDPDQADYLAMMTWIEAQRPEWSGREKTLEKIAVLERCIKKNENSERAYFWRGMLYKRIDEPSKAIKDFKKAMDLNPRNLDAAREVRLHNIRGGHSKPPPGAGGRPSKAPQPETLGGLFGKLFKK